MPDRVAPPTTAGQLMAARLAAIGLDLLVWSMSVEEAGASCTVHDGDRDGRGVELLAQPLLDGLFVHGTVHTALVTFTRLDLADEPAEVAG